MVLQRAYGFRPLYFTIFEGDLLSACLPVMEIDSFLTGRRGVSLPFTDFCEPLVSADGQFEELFREATAYGKSNGWKSLELRGGGAFLAGRPASSAYLVHTLDLTGGEKAVYAGIRESTRRSVRKARATGVNLEILTTETAMRKFYRLNQITRREHGLPPQPYRFFEEVHAQVISKGHGFVAMASHGSEAIAASVYFHFGKRAIYKYGASDRRFQHLRPNNLVMWEAIRQSIGDGCTSLSLGRTDPEHTGLRQFKTGWGGEEHSINYYKCGLRACDFMGGHRAPVNGLAGRILAHTPLPVLRVAGSVLYRHMG
jgi:hypothetical protein